MSETDTVQIIYNAEPTLSRFHRSDAFYRGIMGPVGSGKSTACCQEIFGRATRQSLFNGKRRSRWAVIRNTYRELEDTTIKTWLDWFPEEYFGKFNYGKMIHELCYQESELEVFFRALDRPKDIKKVLSMELTGAWVNEAREVPKGIIDALGDRTGRYPSKKKGGFNWRGVIMDTNPPDDDHWWYKLSEVERPEDWEFFRQPGGLIEKDGKFFSNPNAENVHNLPEGEKYYVVRMHGKSPEYVRVYYCGQYGFIVEGKPVIHEYVDAIHCSPTDLQPIPGLTLHIGLDFGLTPAAVFGQELPMGRWHWIDELVTERMGAKKFAIELKKMLNRDYRGYKYRITGDPAGNATSETDEKTVFQVLEANGILADAASTNSFSLRREAIASPMTRMIDGKPGFQISPKCKITRKGLAGGYCFKRLQVTGQERYQDKPDKNRFSHPVDAGGYMMIGAGVGDQLIYTSSYDVPLPTQAKMDYNELNY